MGIHTVKGATPGDRRSRVLVSENTELSFEKAGDAGLRRLDLEIIFEVAQQVVQDSFSSTFLLKGAPRIDGVSSELRPGLLFFLAGCDGDHGRFPTFLANWVLFSFAVCSRDRLRRDAPFFLVRGLIRGSAGLARNAKSSTVFRSGNSGGALSADSGAAVPKAEA
jgi:hypothetical protein